jgi:O-antigen/teichoic acid export membrane protein
LNHVVIQKLRGRWATAVGLIFFQVLGLAIPLLVLPLLSRALGTGGFGQLMLAQAVVLLAVLWVDAAFNVQSQREASADIAQEKKIPQALLDNLIVRIGAALLAIVFLLCLPLFLHSLSYSLLLASCPLLVGTLIFPQWWLLATGRGLLMGVATVLGRIGSALLVWLYVDSAADTVVAALAISVGSLLSGFILIPIWLGSLIRARSLLSWTHWHGYARTIRPTLLSAFFASACAQLPIVALGTWAGAIQTGLFSAADRLTRAGAHVLTLVEQSLLTQWLQPIATNKERLNKMRSTILLYLSVGLVFGVCVAWFLAPWIIHFLYSDSFLLAVDILRVLLVWLFLQAMRRAVVSAYWIVEHEIKAQAKIQWLETFLYLSLLVLGALFIGRFPTMSWGLWMAFSLCLIEVILLLAFRFASNWTKQINTI